jgi:hypothetical protein
VKIRESATRKNVGRGTPLASIFGLQNATSEGSAVCKSLKNLVGLPRFELGTSCTPSNKYQ